MNDAPCKNCEERYIGCHAHCKKYKQFRNKLKANAQTVAMQNNIMQTEIIRKAKVKLFYLKKRGK